MVTMDALPSSEFRKRYAKLTEPTQVTVAGRVIGQWIPAVTTVPKGGTFADLPPDMAIKEAPRTIVELSTIPLDATERTHEPRGHTFTPVPKPSTKKRRA